MKRKLSKVIAFLLSAVMLLSIMPTYAFASIAFKESQLNVVTDKASTLANGVEQNAYTVYDKNGEQVNMFVTTADMNVDTVKLFASYKDMNPTSFGMSKLTEQVAAFNKKAADGDAYYQGTVVAGINASYYNMTTGQPTGIFVMNGVVGNSAESAGYFAVMKDGSVKIAKRGSYAADKGNIQEAIGIYTMLIEDGKICSGLDSTAKYPRQTIGITADGKVVLMTADGNQAPSSVGLTVLEQAQAMKDLGCVWAGHLDGGGSTTYACKPEGSDDFIIKNSPSDGSERSVSNGLIIVSTEAASYSFDHVTFSAENEYVTPGTSVNVAVAGASSTGNSADIPADITYKVENGKFENGVFTAGNDTKDATITAMYDGKEVGSTTIHVVVPDGIKFSSSEITVPYGKTVDLGVTALYGINEVTINSHDVAFTLADSSLGTISGFDFTARNDGDSAETVITAVLSLNNKVTVFSKIKLGKGSEVIADFEDGTSNIYTYDGNYNYYLPRHSEKVVTAETGKVHSGKNALAVNVDYSNNLESGYQRMCLAYSGETLYLENATSLGMWLYIPFENVSLRGDWVIPAITAVNDDGSYTISSNKTGHIVDGSIDGSPGYVSTFEESGWHYISIDVSAYKGAVLRNGYVFFQFYISDRDGSAYNYYFKNQHNLNGNYTFYIDDITVDYSSAVDDRESPVFSELNYGTKAMSDANVISKNSVPTVSYNSIDFAAKVAENTAKSNATGINPASAKAYIDGNETACTYSNGIISMDRSAVLSNGQHTIKFSIYDNQGNYSSIIRKINVQASADKPEIRVVAHDSTADRVLLGSVQYIDIVADNSENVQSVELKLNLDNMSKWQLDNMEVADGFQAEWSMENYDATDNIATIKITRTGNTQCSGESILASLPVRAWTLENSKKEKPLNAGKAWSLAEFKANKEFWPIAIDLEIEKGLVQFTDGSADTFTGEDVFIWTEMWANYGNMTSTAEGKAYFNSWNGGHTHTAEAIADKAATCTENGYTDRTFCNVCNSVVDWGTKLPAAGHNYQLTDGKLACTGCGDLFNGVFTDGKTYVNGVVIADGWSGDSYYLDGAKLTGVQEVDGCYYDFGDNGVCEGKVKYTGIFEKNGSSYFAKMGVLTSGWQSLSADDGESYIYYFDKSDFKMHTGVSTIDGLTYTFDENGRMTRGAFRVNEKGTKYFVAGESLFRRFITLEEGTYWLNEKGYVAYGNAYTVTTNVKDITWYHFDEETGLLTGLCSGMIDYEGEEYYCDENGKVFYGAIQLDDGIIFSATRGKIVKNAKCYISGSNMLNGCSLDNGLYWCDENGYILANGFAKIDGSTYHYNDYKLSKGFTKIGNAYYMFNASSGKMYSDATMWVGNNTYGIKEGFYFFGADGAMLKTGINEQNGEYCYVQSNGELIKNSTIWVSQTNDLLESGEGYYAFDASGKLIKTGFVTGGGATYYYDNAVRVKGLTKIDNLYYMFNASSGKLYKNQSMWIGANNAYGIEEGFYFFGEDGSCFIPDPVNGVKAIVEENGKLYFTVDGIKKTDGINELDGEYYYAASSGELAADATIWVSRTNDLLASGEGYYAFDASGKLIKTGFVTGGGATYYYDNTVRAKGLTKIGNLYYMFNASSGKMYSDMQLWIGSNAYGVEEGMYYFGADGSTFIPDSVNGVKAIVEENGKLYFTVDGIKKTDGINELDGEYYYAASSGELAADATIWVSRTNDLLASGEGYYAFDASGKLIKTGFVTGGGATYYYDNAVRAKGLTKIGGEYYMLNASSGKMYSDMQLWVGSNAYGIKEGMYYFGADGVMVQK